MTVYAFSTRLIAFLVVSVILNFAYLYFALTTLVPSLDEIALDISVRMAARYLLIWIVPALALLLLSTQFGLWRAPLPARAVAFSICVILPYLAVMPYTVVACLVFRECV